jgi:hypothetical protein
MQTLVIFLICLIFYGGMIFGKKWYKDHTFEEREREQDTWVSKYAVMKMAQ